MIDEKENLIKQIKERRPKSYELLQKWREISGYKHMCLSGMTIFQLRLFKYYLEQALEGGSD